AWRFFLSGMEEVFLNAYLIARNHICAQAVAIALLCTRPSRSSEPYDFMNVMDLARPVENSISSECPFLNMRNDCYLVTNISQSQQRTSRPSLRHRQARH